MKFQFMTSWPFCIWDSDKNKDLPQSFQQTISTCLEEVERKEKNSFSRTYIQFFKNVPPPTSQKFHGLPTAPLWELTAAFGRHFKSKYNSSLTMNTIWGLCFVKPPYSEALEIKDLILLHFLAHSSLIIHPLCLLLLRFIHPEGTLLG